MASEEMNLENVKVLIVEDNLVARKIMERFFDTLKADYHSVDNAAEAEKLNKEYTFDLGFLDLNIPDMPGLDLAQKIKTHRSEVKLIAMTAFVESFTREECLKKGFTELLLKPLDLESIRRVISSSLYDKSDSKLESEDVYSVLKYFGGDIDFMQKSYELLISDFEQRISDIEKAIKIKDYENLSHKAHALKSSLVYFGKSEALEALKTIELAAKKSQEINYLYPINTVKQGPKHIKKKIEEISKNLKAKAS